MDEDAVLSKITHLLEKGCTMLAMHHDCGAPLFRCKGEIVCPVCSFPEPSDDTNEPVAASSLNETLQAMPGLSSSSLSSHRLPSPLADMTSEAGRVSERDEGLQCSGRARDEEWISLSGRLRACLLHRLQGFAEAMAAEQDLDRLKKELDCVEGLLRVLRALQE